MCWCSARKEIDSNSMITVLKGNRVGPYALNLVTPLISASSTGSSLLSAPRFTPDKQHYRPYIDGRNSSSSILRSRQTNDLESRSQVLRNDGRPFPLGWDKTIGWMDSRVKK